MLALPAESEVLERLVAWGEAHESIRALILTSSRARSDGSVDTLSDYDLIVAVTDTAGFTTNDEWVSAYGEPLARWGDQSELYGLTNHFLGVVYADGVKVDYTVWPEALLERVAEAEALPEELDVGYRVLLDKQGRTAGWKAPTYRAHIPAPPTETEYRAIIEEFWWDTTYVAKALWRGEVVFAKFALDYDAKIVALRRVLEWRIELDHECRFDPVRTAAASNDACRPTSGASSPPPTSGPRSRRTGTRSSAPRPSSVAWPQRSATRSATPIPSTWTRQSATTSRRSGSSPQGTEGNSGSRDHSCQEPA